VKSFTQIPNEVATASISDALCRLLLYCYGNADSFRYSVPHLMDVLHKDKRSVQRYIKEFVSGSVFIQTTPQRVKHGMIPNYLFNSDAVLMFLSTKAHATEPTTEPATRPTTRDHTNNTNKQDQETIEINKRSTSTIDLSTTDLASASSGSVDASTDPFESDPEYQKWKKRKDNPLSASGSIEEMKKQIHYNLSRLGF